MPKGQLTEPRKAYQVRDLAALGEKPTDISKQTSLPVSTVKEIILGQNGWTERLKDPSFTTYRSERKRQLQAASLELSSRLLDHADLNLERVSPYQAIGMYGIIRDKERLDAGEATANVSVHSKHEIIGNEQALASLMASMGMDATKVMGYSPAVIEDGHGEDAISNTSDSQSNTVDAEVIP